MCKAFPSYLARSRTSCKISTLAMARINSLAAHCLVDESDDVVWSTLRASNTLLAK